MGIDVSGTTVLVKTEEAVWSVTPPLAEKIPSAPAPKDGKEDTVKVRFL